MGHEEEDVFVTWTDPLGTAFSEAAFFQLADKSELKTEEDA